jgi:hypothetical protein
MIGDFDWLDSSDVNSKIVAIVFRKMPVRLRPRFLVLGKSLQFTSNPCICNNWPPLQPQNWQHDCTVITGF